MRPIRLYLASATNEASASLAAARTLVRSGHYVITHAWMHEVLDVKHGGEDVEQQRKLNFSDRTVIAKVDMSAVRSADVVWLRVPNSLSYGCWVEWGMAIAARDTKPMTLVASGDFDRSLFCSLADFVFESHAEALRRMVEMPGAVDPHMNQQYRRMAVSRVEVDPGSGSVKP